MDGGNGGNGGDLLSESPSTSLSHCPRNRHPQTLLAKDYGGPCVSIGLPMEHIGTANSITGECPSFTIIMCWDNRDQLHSKKSLLHCFHVCLSI